MEKIRVLQCFGSMNIGGAETMMMNILEEISSESCQCDFLVFCKEKGSYEDIIEKSGGRIYRLQSLSEIGILSYIHAIENLIRQNGGYDVVHSHMDWIGGFIAYAAYRANVRKRIVHAHAVQTIFSDSLIKKLSIFISKFFTLFFATDYLACSREAANSLFFRDKKAVILKNAINLKRLCRISKEEEKKLKFKYHIEKDEVILGNIGSMSINKNQIFLLKLLQELNQRNSKYILFLIGNGEEEGNLKEYAKKNKLENIYWIDKTRDINVFLSIFDYFLFPSYKEGLGMVAIEAQAMGVPCIVSNSIPATIDMGAGLIKRCSLKKEEDWINTIIKWNRGKEDIAYMKNIIIENGYGVQSNCELLQKIYRS